MNRSNERERLVFVRLTKLRRSAQAKYERNSIQALDAPNSQRCIVMFPSFVSTLSYGSGRITRIWPFLLWWWIMGEKYSRGSTFFFVIKIRLLLFRIRYSFIIRIHAFIYIMSFWLFYFLVIYLLYMHLYDYIKFFFLFQCDLVYVFKLLFLVLI